jgi:2,5-diketo-D-gluconate reductase A
VRQPVDAGAVSDLGTHRERIAENAQIFDFTLTDEDIAELDRLDRTGGTATALENRWRA